MVAWSYSSIKTFDQCPRKYYHLRVLKDVKDEAGPAADYGTAVHEAAEKFVRDHVPIPAKYKFIEPVVSALKSKPGVKHCELKLAVQKTEGGYAPCEFFAPEVWWRGIADLLVVNDSKAVLVDYKTGKNARYADPKQLDLLAGAVFTHFPSVERVKSALIYVVSKELVRKIHVRSRLNDYFSVFDSELERLAGAQEHGVWNAKTGPLCRFCPVVSCEHNSKR